MKRVGLFSKLIGSKTSEVTTQSEFFFETFCENVFCDRKIYNNKMLSTRNARKENEISTTLGKMKLNDENLVSLCSLSFFVSFQFQSGMLSINTRVQYLFVSCLSFCQSLTSILYCSP